MKSPQRASHHLDGDKSGLFEGCPGKNEVFGTGVTEPHGGLHLVPRALDVDDHALTEDRVFDVVTNTKAHL